MMGAPYLEMGFYEATRSAEAYAAWLHAHPQAPGRSYGHRDFGEAQGPLALHVLLGYLSAIAAIQKEIDVVARIDQTPRPDEPMDLGVPGVKLTPRGLGRLVHTLRHPEVPWGPNAEAALSLLLTAWSIWKAPRRELDALWSEALRVVNEATEPMLTRQIAAEKTSVAYERGVLLFRNVPELTSWQAALAYRPQRVMETLLNMPPRETLLKTPGAASRQVNVACQDTMLWAIQAQATPSEAQEAILAERYPDALAAWRARERHEDLGRRPAALSTRPRRRS